MKLHTKAVGDISEAMVMASLLRAGYTVLKPVGDNQRYDLVIDHGGQFYRVQCKTGRFANGSVTFSLCSYYTHSGRSVVRNYQGDAEFFGVYCPSVDACYIVPVRSTGNRQCLLRVHASRNGQRKGIRLASDFAIPPSSAGLKSLLDNLPAPVLAEPESSTRSTDRNRRVSGEARESTTVEYQSSVSVINPTSLGGRKLIR